MWSCSIGTQRRTSSILLAVMDQNGKVRCLDKVTVAALQSGELVEYKEQKLTGSLLYPTTLGR